LVTLLFHFFSQNDIFSITQHTAVTLKALSISFGTGTSIMKKNSQQQNYALAPIIEAVIDFRVLPNADIDFTALEHATRKVFLKDFPVVAKQIQNQFLLQGGENPTANPILSSPGLRFTSEDNKEILQLKTDGFTYSKLAPYDTWKSFKGNAEKLWSIYQDITKPQYITRTAVRFINKFDLPNSKLELSKYLNIFPQLPDSSSMNGFSMQIVQNQPDLNSTLIITQASIPSPEGKSDTISILLDFDLFNEEKRELDDNIWVLLDKLRLRKNEIFENSITDKTRKLIS
jgi:uncharacterized protein (TIGR04255 family)